MKPICTVMPGSSKPVQLSVRTLAKDMEQGDNEGETSHGLNKASLFHRIFTPSSQASILEVFSNRDQYQDFALWSKLVISKLNTSPRSPGQTAVK